MTDVVQGLCDAVDELDIPIDGQSIAAVIAIKDRLDAKICGPVADFDRDGLWAFDHATSMSVWLRTKARCSNRDSVRMAATAQKLRVMPSLYAAWLDGRLSSGQIDVVEANITNRTLELFAEYEARVCAAIEPLDITETKNSMRHLAALADAVIDAEDKNGAGKANRLHLSRTLDGRGVLNGDLDTETTELLDTALTLADDKDLDVAASQRRGDALRIICQFFLDNHTNRDVTPALPGQRRNRPHLHLIVDPDGRGETEDGTPVPGSTVEKLKCDARVNDVRLVDGQVLYYGKTKRTAPDHLYDALVVRDRGCRFPGCERPARWCSAHHVVPWDPKSGDGPTDIDNMVLLCSSHHDRVHQPGWHQKLLPNAVYEVTAPDDTTMTSRPPGDPDGPQRRLFPQ